jgi:stage V sporulation protein S
MEWSHNGYSLLQLSKYCKIEIHQIGISGNRSSIAKGVSPMDIIKVSSTSRTSAVAGAIAGVIREHKYAEVQAIGAGAVNQAVKATAIARGYLLEDGIDVICMPEFTSVDIDGKERTAIRLVVEPR